MSFLFKNYSLEKVIHLLLDAIRLGYSCETNNTDRNGVNSQNKHTHTHTHTHTPSTHRKINWKGLAGCPRRVEKLEKGLFFKFGPEKLENICILQQLGLE